MADCLRELRRLRFSRASRFSSSEATSHSDRCLRRLGRLLEPDCLTPVCIPDPSAADLRARASCLLQFSPLLLEYWSMAGRSYSQGQVVPHSSVVRGEMLRSWDREFGGRDRAKLALEGVTEGGRPILSRPYPLLICCRLCGSKESLAATRRNNSRCTPRSALAKDVVTVSTECVDN